MIEDEWIVKYRAALIATQIKPSRAETIIAGLREITQELVSAIGKASHNKTTAYPEVQAFEPLRPVRATQVPGPEYTPQGRLDGSNTQHPGKRISTKQHSSHLRRRKAS